MRYFKRFILLSCLSLPLLANYQLFADSVDKTSNILIVQEESNKRETFSCWLDLSPFNNDLSGLISSVMEVILLDIFHGCIGVGCNCWKWNASR